MGTPNKHNQLLVKTPKYSIFDVSNDSKLTYEMGRIVPINKGYELMPGDEIDINIQQLTRFMPMLSPVFQRYVLDFIPVFVPYRLLWSEDAPIWNANKFFNPATPDSERPAVPMTSWKQLFNNVDHKIFGSLFDYLGYPTLTGLYEASIGLPVDLITGSDSTIDNQPFDSIFAWSNRFSGFKLKYTYLGTSYTHDFLAAESSTTRLSFWYWICHNYLDSTGYSPSDIARYKSWDDVINSIPGKVKFSDLQDEYLSYMFNYVVSQVITSGAKDLSLLPWLCYHKAFSDWFVRTDMIDPDTYMSNVKSVCNSIVSYGNSLSEVYSSQENLIRKLICSGSPCTRLWMDDYFTTAMTSLQSGANVAIPVNGTIQQLWTANRLEQFRMRIQLAGKRYMDQILQLFGVKVPDARLQRTEVLGHLKFNLVVNEVLQTSAAQIDSSLGQFAGTAISSNGSHLCHYKADEPGYLMILASVRPTTSYVDQTPRLILRKDYYDWANPMFDNVGVQAIMNNELCYRPGDTSVFGYSQRRYAEFMTNFGEVHGDFKTNLDYWHAARKFDLSTSVPALNNDFISIDKADSLDRIFASQLGANLLSQIYCDARVTRPLSRYVNYHM